MQQSRHRRDVLAGAATLVTGFAGCTGTRGNDDPDPERVESTTTQTPPPPPSAAFPVLPDRDVEFGGEVSFPEAGRYGWLLEFSFTGTLDLSATSPDGGAVSVAVTDEQVDDDGTGGGSRLASFAAPDAVDSVEVTDGVASIVFEARAPATVDVGMSVELI